MEDSNNTEITQSKSIKRSIWTPEIIVAILAVLIGFVTSDYFYNKSLQNTKKDLLVNLKTMSPIINDQISSDLQFTVNGIKADNIYYIEIYFSNIGMVPILKEDFYENKPLLIDFGKECKIVSFRLPEAQDNLGKRIKVKSINGALMIDPVLINPNEQITITAVTANCSPAFSISGDIVGIKKISENWTLKEPTLEREFTYVLILTVVVFAISLYYFNSKKSDSPVGNAISTTFVFFFIALISTSVLKTFRDKTMFVNQIPEICRTFIEKNSGE